MTDHTSSQSELKEILNRIVANGDYEAALLSDGEGLPLAVAAATETADMMAAITALLRKAGVQARDQLSLANINELSLVGDDRFRLVCRFFQTDDGEPLNLTVMVPPDQSYRHITNKAIARLKAAWNNFKN